MSIENRCPIRKSARPTKAAILLSRRCRTKDLGQRRSCLLRKTEQRWYSGTRGAESTRVRIAAPRFLSLDEWRKTDEPQAPLKRRCDCRYADNCRTCLGTTATAGEPGTCHDFRDAADASSSRLPSRQGHARTSPLHGSEGCADRRFDGAAQPRRTGPHPVGCPAGATSGADAGRANNAATTPHSLTSQGPSAGGRTAKHAPRVVVPWVHLGAGADPAQMWRPA
jgi:hypothetical protein